MKIKAVDRVVVDTLIRHGEMTTLQIADRAGVQLSEFSNRMGRLERQGLIMRVGKTPKQRRTIWGARR